MDSAIPESSQPADFYDIPSRFALSISRAWEDTLPVARAVERGGYASVSEYMRELVRKAKAQRDLETELRAGLESPDLGEFDKAYFSNLKRKVKKASTKGKA